MLITKWRNTARDAAEELFRTAKDQVNRMGGVGVWRERSQRRNEPWADADRSGSGWGQGNEVDEGELNEEQKAQLSFLREEAERDRARYAVVDTKEAQIPVKEDQDDEVCARAQWNQAFPSTLTVVLTEIHCSLSQWI